MDAVKHDALVFVRICTFTHFQISDEALVDTRFNGLEFFFWVLLNVD
jgi:hypothetical protein